MRRREFIAGLGSCGMAAHRACAVGRTDKAENDGRPQPE
jgi:hypothetical protein